MPKSKPRSDEVKFCYECFHFKFGVCDIYKFRYDPSWICDRMEYKDAETETPLRRPLLPEVSR